MSIGFSYAIITLELLIFLVFAARRFGFFSLVGLFTYSQYAMAAGVLGILDLRVEADRLHQLLVVLTFTAFQTGILLVLLGLKDPKFKRSHYRPSIHITYPKWSVHILIAISLVIGIAYFFAVGYVAFFASVSSLLGGESTDVQGLRLESYSGSRYLFPGYVNQFKNSLLPALFLVVLAATFWGRKRNSILITLVLGLLVVVLLIGTGQRHPLVRFLVMGVLFFQLIAPRLATRVVIGVGSVGLPIFFLTSFATGRMTRELDAAEGIVAKAWVFVDQFASRLFSSSQESAQAAFRYTHAGQDIFFGSEWMLGIKGLLPGSSGSTLAHEVYKTLYGTDRGTAPASLWGSMHYNFGTWFTVFLAFALGVLFALISISFLRRKSLNSIQAVGIAGITTILGLWISDGPTTLLNTGLVVYCFLLFWGDRIAETTDGQLSPHSQNHVGNTRPNHNPDPASLRNQIA